MRSVATADGAVAGVLPSRGEGAGEGGELVPKPSVQEGALPRAPNAWEHMSRAPAGEKDGAAVAGVVAGVT